MFASKSSTVSLLLRLAVTTANLTRSHPHPRRLQQLVDVNIKGF
jgi:hypothetical protein